MEVIKFIFVLKFCKITIAHPLNDTRIYLDIFLRTQSVLINLKYILMIYNLDVIKTIITLFLYDVSKSIYLKINY